LTIALNDPIIRFILGGEGMSNVETEPLNLKHRKNSKNASTRDNRALGKEEFHLIRRVSVYAPSKA
jgi:hypothetical protein